MACSCGCGLPGVFPAGHGGASSSSSSSSAACAGVGEEDEEDIFEWEVRDSGTPFWQHAIAGSCAGVMEHIGMFPIDTVKTRIQASPVPVGVMETFRAVHKERGFFGLMRGSSVIGVGCVPAHVGLFGTYEVSKTAFLDQGGEAHQPMRAALCGALATLAHDSVLTPMDVVKQRLQMGRYLGALDCISSIYRSEGFGAFYRSLPTTLAMNVPYMGLLVASNESLKRMMNLEGLGSSLASAPWYFVTAGLSGAVAAAVTLPLDVVKTRLQTQGMVVQPLGHSCCLGSASSASSARRAAGASSPPSAPRYRGLIETVQAIGKEQGARGFWRGLGPRVMLAMPSAAICWGTYETTRAVLTRIPAEESAPGRPPAGTAAHASRAAAAAARRP